MTFILTLCAEMLTCVFYLRVIMKGRHVFKYLVFYMCVGVVYAEENGKKIAKEKENTSKSISYEKYSTTE